MNKKIVVFLSGISLIYAFTFLSFNELDKQESFSLAKDFMVIKVLGKVKVEQDTNYLKRGSFFSKDNILVFNSPNDRIAVVDSRKSAFIVRPATTPVGYHLIPTRTKWDTRPGKILTYEVFRNYLENRKILALGDTTFIEVGKEEFPLNEQSFFYVQYVWNQDTINKKLAYEGQKIIFDKPTIYQIDGIPIAPTEVSNMVLFYYYYNAEMDDYASLKINNMDLVFPDETNLLEEVRLLLKDRQKENKKAQKKYIEDFLFNFYGQPEKENFDEWMKEHFSW